MVAVTVHRPAFARDAATARYYEARAEEYDEWYEGRGRFAARDRPGWAAELDRLVAFVRELAPARTLDVACGTGFLTRHLRDAAVGLDVSPRMLAVTRRRVAGPVVAADALALPFADRAFDRVLTGHFYGHLPPDERHAFLAEARRVAAELVVIDSALRPGIDAEQWQERVLNDGSRHRVFKRFLSAEQLAAEIDGEVRLAGTWFVAARS
jgi:demethylmenaquinone methyltransferase/2-methoxy-6-polyprenyl-1,4-benzoquinol methylase